MTPARTCGAATACVIARVPPSPVWGGRAEDFRIRPRRTSLAPPLLGRYRVDVVTAADPRIGRRDRAV
jgi:hypothetical protein